MRASDHLSSFPPSLSLSFTLSLLLFSTESSNQAADNELAWDGGWLFAFLNHSRGGRYKESRRYTAGMRIDADYPEKHLRDLAFTRLWSKHRDAIDRPRANRPSYQRDFIGGERRIEHVDWLCFFELLVEERLGIGGVRLMLRILASSLWTLLRFLDRPNGYF